MISRYLFVYHSISLLMNDVFDANFRLMLKLIRSWMLMFLFLFQTMYSDGLLTLHYGKHPATLAAEVGAWYSGDRHVDVTLACDDGSIVKAHRVVLAAASPLLASLLRNPALDHVVHLSGVRKTQLNHLLEFLYNGEALIPVWILRHNIVLARKQNISKEKAY